MLCGRAGPAVPQPRSGSILRLHPGPSPAQRERARRVRSGCRHGRLACPDRRAGPRRAAILTGWHHAGFDAGPRLPMLSAYLGPVSPASTYWYLSASPSCWPRRPDASPAQTPEAGMTALAARCGRLHGAAGRPAKRQPEGRRGLPRRVPAPARLRAGDHRHRPGQVVFDDLDAPLISAFLDHLESQRGVTIKTRNSRLAAALAVPLRRPEHAALIQRVLAIPAKRAQAAHLPPRGVAEPRAVGSPDLFAPGGETRRCWRRSRPGGASPTRRPGATRHRPRSRRPRHLHRPRPKQRSTPSADGPCAGSPGCGLRAVPALPVGHIARRAKHRLTLWPPTTCP